MLRIIARLFGVASPGKGDGLRLGSGHVVGVGVIYNFDLQATQIKPLNNQAIQ